LKTAKCVFLYQERFPPPPFFWASTIAFYISRALLFAGNLCNDSRWARPFGLLTWET